MRYRAEMMQQNVVVSAINYTDATHPQQVVRRIVESQPIDIDYADVYVMNERGERWKYSIARTKDGKLYAKTVGALQTPLSKDKINSVFAGNTYIRVAGRE